MARSLEEILKSTSDVLFPAHAGEYPVSIDSEGYDGDRPLHVSVWRRDLEAVEVLLRAGADPNALGEMDQTPLHVAVTTANVEIAAALLKHGARGDVRSEFGDTPRELAAALGAPMLQLFNEPSAQKSGVMTEGVDPRWYQLRDAVYNRRYGEAAALLEQDKDLLRALNGIGETVLHFLAVENDLEGVAWLHAQGADINTKNRFGTPAMFEVAQLEYKDLYAWFRRNGADRTLTDAEGNDVAEYLVTYQMQEMAAWIRNNDA